MNKAMRFDATLLYGKPLKSLLVPQHYKEFKQLINNIRSKMKVDNNKVLTILYKNWKDKTSIRKIQPVGNMYWGTTQYHTEPQWLFDVWDLDKEDHRTYAVSNIISILNNDIDNNNNGT